MTLENKPIATHDSDSWPLTRTGMTLRRKLMLVAIPAILAIVAVPVGIAHAHGVAQGRVASTPTVHMTRSVAIKHVHAVAPKAATKTTAVKHASLAAGEAAETTTETAETGTDTGHTDEVAGSTTESTVDHQFEGQE
jgi:hypothetical protein